jgi:predicted GIY-YIG superfamily endonuclease
MVTNPQQHKLSLKHGVAGTVYVLHFEPGYKHARHYIGWTAGDDVTTRLQVHLQGRGSPLIRAAVQAGVEVQLAATYPGTRHLERRLKRWHKTGQFCAICRQQRGGRAR